MQPGGKLKIKSRADDESVFLLFGDSGAGIKQEDLARLFQPYHTTKPGGHGLGLMIVQRIMREHGGQVGIESKEGLGTIVTLQFPRKDRRVRMLRWRLFYCQFCRAFSVPREEPESVGGDETGAGALYDDEEEEEDANDIEVLDDGV